MYMQKFPDDDRIVVREGHNFQQFHIYEVVNLHFLVTLLFQLLIHLIKYANRQWVENAR